MRWTFGWLAVAGWWLAICGSDPLAAGQSLPPQQLKAGAALADITPPLGEMIVGGFAPFPSTNVHDPLHVRCLALDNGQTRLAFVICDNLGISRAVYDEARKRIETETGFPAANILMAATHTHSGTRAETEKYRPIVVAGIVKALQQALENMEPARIAFGEAYEPTEVFNRRWHTTNPELLQNPFGGVDKVRMNPPRGDGTLVKPAGPVDPEISFISVQSVDGRPLALLANYSLHYVGGVANADISADYFAIFSRRIGELIEAKQDGAKPFVGMLSNGTSGDVNNINFTEKSPKRYESYEKMTEVAEHVAQKVKAAHGKLTWHDWVPLAVVNRDLKLKVRKPDQSMQDYIATVRAKPEGAVKYHPYETNYADRVQALLEGPDEITIPLQAIRLGDLGIVAIPFEVFTEIGLEIKEKSPLGDAFTIELANSSHGYLPTPEQHELGGYETWMGTNKVQLDASVLITNNLLEMLGELKRGK